MDEEKQPYEMKVVDKRFNENDIILPAKQTDLIRAAIQNKYQPELIEKMMDLQERFEKNEAKKDYFEAVAAFKAEAPPVKKDKYNKWFESWYTSLGNLLDTYNPFLGKHGLSISFSTPEQTEKTMTVECKLSHKSGHSESECITAPIDQAAVGKVSGQKSRNPIQDIKSTFTYLRSATCEAILGVSGTEASSIDDDGNSAGEQHETKFISEDQKKKIESLMIKTDINATVFLKSLKVDDLEKLPARQYDYAMGILKARAKSQSKEIGDK